MALLPGFNDLGTRFPDIAAEWHPIRNSDVTPERVSYGSGKKVWWLGVCGHEWEAVVCNRTGQGSGCPVCAGQRVSAGFNDLGSQFPVIAAQWHPIRNGDRTPEQVTGSSGRKVWWLGKCGHEWNATIDSRTRTDAGCPVCFGRGAASFLAGFNDLRTLSPAIAEEWHPIKNGDRTPEQFHNGSGEEVWWLGPCGHEWEATIHSRKYHGCPFCCGQRVLIGFNDLGSQSPDVAAEWHPTRNDDRTPEQIGNTSSKKVWWLGKCGHEWKTTIDSRTRLRVGCPFCAGQRVLTGFNDLLTRFPAIAMELHPARNNGLNPEQVYFGSAKKVWWLCSVCGHEWATEICSRSSGSGCLKCGWARIGISQATPKPGESLADVSPGLAAEWHPTKNDDLTPERVYSSSGKKVWWLGSCGHEWEAYVNNRARGHGCPVCVFYNTSMEEIRLRCELQAAGLPIDETGKVRLSGRTRPYDCDIVCSDWKLIVEFDGKYFHSSDGGITRDTEKTIALTTAGWTVIRVRDGLPVLFDNDVTVSAGATALVRAKAVIRKAATLGFLAPRYDEYLASNYPLGEVAARVIIAQERKPKRSVHGRRSRRHRPSADQIALW